MTQEFKDAARQNAAVWRNTPPHMVLKFLVDHAEDNDFQHMLLAGLLNLEWLPMAVAMGSTGTVFALQNVFPGIKEDDERFNVRFEYGSQSLARILQNLYTQYQSLSTFDRDRFVSYAREVMSSADLLALKTVLQQKLGTSLHKALEGLWKASDLKAVHFDIASHFAFSNGVSIAKTVPSDFFKSAAGEKLIWDVGNVGIYMVHGKTVLRTDFTFSFFEPVTDGNLCYVLCQAAISANAEFKSAFVLCDPLAQRIVAIIESGKTTFMDGVVMDVLPQDFAAKVQDGARHFMVVRDRMLVSWLKKTVIGEEETIADFFVLDLPGYTLPVLQFKSGSGTDMSCFVTVDGRNVLDLAKKNGNKIKVKLVAFSEDAPHTWFIAGVEEIV